MEINSRQKKLSPFFKKGEDLEKNLIKKKKKYYVFKD